MENLRIYSFDYINHWGNPATMFEYSYREYDFENDLVGEGTEDFSRERREIATYRCSVYTWDGVSLNKGGKKKHVYRGAYRVSDRKLFRRYWLNKGYADVRIEKW